MEILKTAFAHDAAWDEALFDPQTRFCKAGDANFEEIYHREGQTQPYTVEELNQQGISIRTK